MAWSVLPADLNGDGKPDLLVTNFASNFNGNAKLGVLLGKGNGFFQPVVAYDAGAAGSSSIAVGDLNGDGQLDVVVANGGFCAVRDNCVSVFLGNADGTLQPAVIFDAGGVSNISGQGINIPIFIADLNGDGKPDLVVANVTDQNQVGDGVIGVLLGNGDGTFQPVVRYDSGGLGTRPAALADVNGDGRLDVVVVNCGELSFYCPPTTATISVLLGNGNGTFQLAKTYSRGAPGSLNDPLLVVDVNGDRKLDIVVGNQCPRENGNCVGDASIGVLLGNGDGTFAGATTYDSGGNENYSLADADFNGDHKIDLAVANNYGTGVLLGNGDGTFQPAQTFAGGGCCQVLVADVNLDGRPDLLAVASTGGNVNVLLGKGDGTFEARQIFSLGGKQFSWVAVADVNKDGRPDLLSANWCSQKTCGGEGGTVSVLLNKKALTTTVLTTSGSPSQLGHSVTFTATVSSKYRAISDGELVNFLDGSKSMGSVALKSGMAELTTSTLSLGTHTIKAKYVGDTFFRLSVGKVAQMVNP